MSAIFKPEHIGQQVSDPLYGNGVITNYVSGDEYPVKVRFGDSTDSFTSDGRRIASCLPTLQFGNLDNYERKLTPALQDGQIIEVEALQNYWRLARIHIINGGTYMAYEYKQNGDPVLHPFNHNWRCAL